MQAQVIHAGLTVDICAMEQRVHTGAILSADLQLVARTLPYEAALVEPAAGGELPGGGAAAPSRASIAFGTGFLRSGRAPRATRMAAPREPFDAAFNVLGKPRTRSHQRS